MEKLDLYIDRVKRLPPSPTVAIQLLNLFSDSDRDIDRIVELVSHDPALTAQTLKRCNSAFIGGAVPASDMFEAVSRLGFYEVYCIVAALMASRTMGQVQGKYGLDATRLWQHTVTTAVIASILAKRVQVLEAAAFTAGLLHDLGKLILVSVDGFAYAEMVRKVGAFGPALAAAEEAERGFTHAALGARLLARWGVPENICVAVQLHHQAPTGTAQFQRIAATVNVGNLLAHQMIDAPPNASAAVDMSPEALDLVDLENHDIPSILEKSHEALEKVQGLLQMKA